jgi:hypothetical protein
MKTANALLKERQDVWEQRRIAENRAAAMLKIGSRLGWQDWSREAYRLSERLESLTEDLELLTNGEV